MDPSYARCTVLPPALCAEATEVAVRIGRAVAREIPAGAGPVRDLIGRVLLFNELEQITGDHEWPQRLHEELRGFQFAVAAKTYEVPLGLEGLAGLVLCLDAVNRRARRYPKMLEALSLWLWRYGRSEQACCELPLWNLRDLLTGAAGCLIAFSRAVPDGTSEPSQLALLCELAEAAERGALYTDGATFVSEERQMYTGMAHGIAGMIAALCIAYPSQHAAIKSLADTLIETAAATSRGTVFPLSVGSGSESRREPSWCNGSAGIVVAMLHAAHVLKRTDYVDVAISALAGMDELLPMIPLNGCGICHGRAGVALTYQWAYEYVADETFRQRSKSLYESVIQAYDPSTTFGYYALMRGRTPEDSCSFINGSVGIALSLLTGAGQCDFNWTSILGIGPALYPTFPIN